MGNESAKLVLVVRLHPPTLMSTEELTTYYNAVIQRFYEMYEPHRYEQVCGYETDDGKKIVVFQNRIAKRPVHVYLNDKGNLMPYFPPR